MDIFDQIHKVHSVRRIALTWSGSRALKSNYQELCDSEWFQSRTSPPCDSEDRIKVLSSVCNNRRKGNGHCSLVPVYSCSSRQNIWREFEVFWNGDTLQFGTLGKRFSPIEVTELGMTIEVNLLQPKNACFPMKVIESGILTDSTNSSLKSPFSNFCDRVWDGY